MTHSYPKLPVILMALIAILSFPAHADRDNRGSHDRDRYGDRNDRDDRDYRWDKRYHLDRRYPRDGYVVKTLPERRYVVRHHHDDYFFFGGVWYRPSGPSFVVVRPPIGIIVPILPPVYATVWIRSRPYYYANEVYYVWRPDLAAYEVVDPPVRETEPEPPLVADELFVYPKEGQSEEKQADDRYACHRWAANQTGYDPTQPPTNLSVSELNNKRESYQRAMRACLEGRGYSVR